MLVAIYQLTLRNVAVDLNVHSELCAKITPPIRDTVLVTEAHTLIFYCTINSNYISLH